MMDVEIYKDRRQEWRWRLVSQNGRIMADSGEGYSRATGARRAIKKIINGISDANIITLYEDKRQ